MGFFRQEYWSGLPVPSPGDLPNPGIEPRSPTLRAHTLTSEPPGKPIFELVLVISKQDAMLLLLLNQIMSNSVTSWTVDCQAPLSMGFPRQEYWSGLPFPPPGDLSDPGIMPTPHALQVDSLLLSHLGRLNINY